MDIWKSQNNPGKQMALSIASTVVGLLLMTGFRDFRNGGSNATAGFFLGVLLLVIGIAAFLASGRQTVTIDPGRGRITIDDSNRFRTTTRSIAFSDILGIGIGYLGKRSNYVGWYYLVLKLRSGEDYPLFAPGRFYEGGSDRSIVEAWKQRLDDYLRQ